MVEAGQAASVPKLPALPSRIVQVFVSPPRLFDALKERPVWIDVLLLIVIINVVVTATMPAEIQRRLIEQFLPAGADPAQLDQMVESGRTRGIVSSVIFTPIMIAVVAGVLMLAYNVILGGEAKFKQLFSATAHAYLIMTAGGLLMLGLIYAGSEQMVLSPALILPDLGDGFLARLLGAINVFSIWMCIVLGIGVSRIYPKRSAAGASTYLIVLYLVQASVTAAFLGLAMSAAG